MENNPFASPESAPSPSTASPKRKSWQKTVGAVFLLVAIVPALVLIVFYYREVSVTYYMTRNPLAPAASHLAVRMQAIILGNLRALAAVASSIVWTSPPPTESNIRQVVGKYVQEGDLAAFAGIAVMDSKGALLAMVDRRDISPYLDVARSLSVNLRDEYSGFSRREGLQKGLSSRFPEVVTHHCRIGRGKDPSVGCE